MSKHPLKPALKGSIAASIVLAVAALLAGTVFETPASDARDLRADQGTGGQVSPQQAPPDLEALKRRMLPLFELDGVVFTDADETRGRLVVGVTNRGLARSVEARLAALGVPGQLIDVRQTAPIVELTTLRDNVDPIRGGLQIFFPSKGALGYFCTLGFNATLGTTNGFVTNSHCTKSRGKNDSTKYYQPTFASANLIGTEIADPPFFQCVYSRKCRYSDAAFAQRSDGSSAGLGLIARTTGPNNGSLDIAGQFTITGEGGVLAGEIVNKVGRTTGWTQGNVTNTCVDTGVQGSNIVMLCQTFVAAGSGGGDSGSPVVKLAGGDNVTLVGILWGGDTAGTMFVYSSIANIEAELGALTTN